MPESNIWDADWQPYDEEEDPFAGDWEATTPGAESPWEADWQPEIEEAPTFGGRVKKSWETGKKQVTLGGLGMRKIYGDERPETETQIQAIQESMAERGVRPERSLPEQAIRAAAEMAPIPLSGMEQGVKRGIPLAVGFGTIAALAGPAAPLTVPAASAAGMSVGMISASLENIAGVEAGLAYLDFRDLEDPETGEKMDETVAKVAGVGVGAINGAIELLQIKTFLRSIPGAETLVRKAVNGSVKKVLKSRALKNIAFRAAKKYATGVASETAQEELQEVVNLSGEYLATEVNNALKGTDIPTKTKKEVVNQLLETGKQSALAFSVFMMPGTAVSTTKEVIDKRKTPDPEVDLFKTKESLDTLESNLREGVNDGKINAGDLRKFKEEMPKGHPALKTIDKLLKESTSTTIEKDLIAGEDLSPRPDEDVMPVEDVEIPPVESGVPIAPPEAGIPMPGAYPPLAATPAETSAQAFEQDRVEQEAKQEEALRLQEEQTTKEERIRQSRVGYEGLVGEVEERAEREEIEGMEYKMPYLHGLLDLVKKGEPGKRIKVEDYDGTEKWFGVGSDYPNFMVSKYSKKEVVKALEKGLSGHEFATREVRQAQIWDDAKEQAAQMRDHDLLTAGKMFAQEPVTIEGLPDQDYKYLITRLQDEGYSTREIEEAASRHRKSAEGNAIASIANEHGFSEEEIREILNDPLEAVSDLDAAWKEAVATKPVSAYLTPITEGEHYEGEAERRLASTEQKAKLIAKLINEKLLPGNDLHYDGIFAFMEGIPPVYQFTPHAGPAFKYTIAHTDLEADAILDKLKTKIDQCQKAEAKKAAAKKAAPEKEFKKAIDLAADDAETEPTEAQKEAISKAERAEMLAKVKVESKKYPAEKPTTKDLASPEGGTHIPISYISELKRDLIESHGPPRDLIDLTEVLDKKNTPRIVYHGTTSDFKSFKEGSKRTANRAIDSSNIYGTFFTTSKSDAVFYSLGGFYGKQTKYSKVIQAYLDIRVPYKVKNTEQILTQFDSHKQAKKWMVDYGYDGLHIVPEDKKTEWWIPFSHKQIIRKTEGPLYKQNALTALDAANGSVKKTIEILKKWGNSHKEISFVKELQSKIVGITPKPSRPSLEGGRLPSREVTPKPLAEKPITEKPAPAHKETLREVFKDPGTSQAEAAKEKAHLKRQVIAGVKSGKYKGAVRFSTVVDLKKTVESDKLYTSRYGEIHATPILGPTDDAFPAYGSYKNHAVAYIIPEKYIKKKPDAHTKEVVVDPETPLSDVTFLVDGQDKEFNILHLIDAVEGAKRPTAKELIKQYRDQHGDVEAFEFYKDTKKEGGKYDWQGAVVHKSSLHEGGWRVTYFDSDGFSGHAERSTLEDVVSEAIQSGIVTPKPGLLDKAAKGKGFIEKTVGTYEAQQAHAEKMAGAEKKPVEAKETLVLTPEKETPWEQQAKLEKEGVVKRPPKEPSQKAKFPEGGIKKTGMVGRQQGLFGAEKGGQADMFAEAEKEGKAKPSILSMSEPVNVRGKVSDGNWVVNYEVPSTLGKTGRQTNNKYFWKKADAQAWIESSKGRIVEAPVTNVELVRKDAKKGRKAGIEYVAQMEVAETGDVVDVPMDAGIALNEADTRLENYNKLLECIESD